MKKQSNLEPSVVFAPARIYDPMDALITLKGYCLKHEHCNDACRLFDIDEEHCFFFEIAAGPPCDWELPNSKEDEK